MTISRPLQLALKVTSLGVGLLFSLIGLFFAVIFARLHYDERMFAIAILTRTEGSRQGPWFDEAKFRRVHVDMSLEQVENLLGPPLHATRYCGDKVIAATALERANCSFTLPVATCPTDAELYLGYVEQGDSKSDYRIRGITIRNGRVVEVINEFETD